MKKALSVILSLVMLMSLVALTVWAVSTGEDENSTQATTPSMPEKLDAPVISDFDYYFVQDNDMEVSFYIEIPDSVYKAVKYSEVVENDSEAYVIETEFKRNDGEWERWEIFRSEEICSGKKSLINHIHFLQPGDEFCLRARIRNWKTEEATEWSNVIGSKDSLQQEKSEVSKISYVWVLGICLFACIAVATVSMGIAKKKKKAT